MKNIILICSLLVFTVGLSSAKIIKLPEDAQTVVNRVEIICLENSKLLLNDIAKKRKKIIGELQKIADNSEDQIIKDLVKVQIGSYERNQYSSESYFKYKEKRISKISISDKKRIQEASRIVDFNKDYYFDSPPGEYQREKGKFILLKNGQVIWQYGVVKRLKFSEQWSWSLEQGRIRIKADEYHDVIYISHKGPKEVELSFGGSIDKIVVARSK